MAYNQQKQLTNTSQYVILCKTNRSWLLQMKHASEYLSFKLKITSPAGKRFYRSAGERTMSAEFGDWLLLKVDLRTQSSFLGFKERLLSTFINFILFYLIFFTFINFNSLSICFLPPVCETVQTITNRFFLYASNNPEGSYDYSHICR